MLVKSSSFLWKKGGVEDKNILKIAKGTYMSIIFDNKLNKFIHKHMENWVRYIGKLIKTVVEKKTVVEQYIMLFFKNSCL